MTLADDLKPLVHSIRSIPGRLGLRPYTVSVVRRAHSGTYSGEGTEVETVTAITESGGYPPKVRIMDSEALALAGLEKGSLEVGPITPDFSAGGTSIATLIQSAAEAGEMVLYRVTGPSGTADYRRVDHNDDRALHYTMRLKPVSSE